MNQITIKDNILTNLIKGIYICKNNHVQYNNIKKKYAGLRKNINKHGLVFHYNIRPDNLLGIGYVAVIQVPCSCSEC